MYKENKKIKKGKKSKEMILVFILVITGIVLGSFFFSISVNAALDPTGPSSILINSNQTKATVNPLMVNISGGRIASINVSANTQDSRWKGFVGFITGKYALDDGAGATLYDWTLSSTTGKIYASRNSSTVIWSSINCSNFTTLNGENILLNHTDSNDNLTVTFNTSSGATHNATFVGSRYIPQDTCPTLNTYVNNGTQDNNFQELALYDGVNIVYGAISEPRRVGYNGEAFDFQMIVPENGLSSFTGQTAYYIYVELGN